MFNKVRVIIGALGLVNALVCLGIGILSYSVYGIQMFQWLLLPEGLVMLGGMYCFYRSRYVLSGLLTLIPSLEFGAYSWVLVFQYYLHFPSAELAWGLAFAIPITTSAIMFLIGIIKWRDKHKARAKRMFALVRRCAFSCGSKVLTVLLS